MPSVAIIGTRGYPSYYGGFETAVRRLSPYLANQGWAVRVYGRPGATRPNDQKLDSRIERIETKGIEKKSLSTLTYGYTSTKHAISHRPDVALVMNVANGFWLPRLKNANIPTLVNVDGIEWDRAKWGKLAKTVFHTGARFTAKYGTRMVYDSKEIARRWLEEFNIDGEFIPYGGDPIEGQLPMEPGLTHRKYVLLVARFVPENTVAEFFEAAPSIAKDMDVVIVGSTGYGGQLDQAALGLSKTNTRIHWLGHVSDDNRLHSLFQHAGVYFHGHSVGGTNPALVQAMASGAPIVARDTAYNREVLGAGGIYAQPDNLTGPILTTARDSLLLDRLSEHNKRRAAEFYSWDRVNAAYMSALTGLIGVSQ